MEPGHLETRLIVLDELNSHSTTGAGKSAWVNCFPVGPAHLIVDANAHARLDHLTDITELILRSALAESESASRELSWQTHLVLNATASLERAQRARLDRVVTTWEEEASLRVPPKPRRRSIGKRFVEWLLGRQQQAADLESFLTEAHRHEAVTRRSARGKRRWFEDWRQHALAALRLGISPGELVELLRSTPVAASVRRAPAKAARSHGADFASLRERLRNVVFPNAPGAPGALGDLITGDGLATARI